MHDRGLPKKLIDQLANHETHKFADSDVWRKHLESPGFDKIKKHPDPVRIASEGAVWGRIATIGLLENVVIVFDGAGQFKIGRHALCRVHGERLVYKLVPVTIIHQKAQDRIRRRIWWLYANLKQYCHDPTAKRKRELQRRFDSIFTSKTVLFCLTGCSKGCTRKSLICCGCLIIRKFRCTPTARKTICVARSPNAKYPAAPGPTRAVNVAMPFCR